jgi:hypothetical protein
VLLGRDMLKPMVSNTPRALNIPADESDVVPTVRGKAVQQRAF